MDADTWHKDDPPKIGTYKIRQGRTERISYWDGSKWSGLDPMLPPVQGWRYLEQPVTMRPVRKLPRIYVAPKDGVREPPKTACDAWNPASVPPARPGYYLTLGYFLGQPMEVVAHWDGDSWSNWADSDGGELPGRRKWRDVGLPIG